MSEIWPWEGISLGPLKILRWKKIEQNPQVIGQRRKEQWDLKSQVIGEEYIKRTGKRYKTQVGAMTYKRY